MTLNALFYTQIDKTDKNELIVNKAEEYVQKTSQQIYIINKPLGEKNYNYKYEDHVVVLLSPNHKMIFIDLSGNEESFGEYCEDFIEDLGSISDKFEYKSFIGRPREWQKKLISQYNLDESFDIKQLLDENIINDKNLKRKCELLISLLLGSINDVEKIGVDAPEALLDKIKSKIVLFDGEQTRFIYKTLSQKCINIQGLSGTGKTELLLHKLKELYTSANDYKIFFTCHNKILAENIKSRIPDFFNFMKVEKQIKWDINLWVINAWGSSSNKNSGVYSYICDFYGIDFLRFNHYTTDFNTACKSALESLKNLKIDEEDNYAFDYILIDESQDFPQSFFDLCERVTRHKIYIAGDIFQNIFDSEIEKRIVNADFILNRCYRTDPRTLMFAHSLGMGLFETKKLNWLTDEEWKASGYILTRGKDNIVNLTREPVRRFEDLNLEDSVSIQLEFTKDEFTEKILEIIQYIKEKNPTIQPDDIAIILLDSGKYIYTLADTLEYMIMRMFNWKVNKGYESKEKIKDALFISNKNNVKGLEFPFVVCVANKIEVNHNFRNTLYTMLTRSFIQSYLLLREDNGLDSIKSGLGIINSKNYIETIEPTRKEKEDIKRTIIQLKEESNMSYKDFLTKIFDSLKIDSKCRKKLIPMIENLLDNSFDKELIIEFIEKNKEYCK